MKWSDPNWKTEMKQALEEMSLHPEEVIRACARVRNELDTEENWARLLFLLMESGLPEREARSRLEAAWKGLAPESLRRQMELEFGPDWVREFSPGFEESFIPGASGCFEENGRRYVQKWRPLGVLFHIGAGNMDGISAFSALEGLLTGNVNLVKLPGGGDPVSEWLISRLLQAEPKLKRYLHLFPIRSEEEGSMRELAEAADAVVVWGGDEAVKAVRRLADPGTKLIEWGNRLSFAYLPAAALNGPEEELDAQLQLLARHMAETDQLLCSSCQGIYVDTERGGTLLNVGRRLLRALEQEMERLERGGGRGWDSELERTGGREEDSVLKRAGGEERTGGRERDRLPDTTRRQAAIALELRTAELESVRERKRVLRGRGCSVIVFGDSRLEVSLQYGNPWVRPLPASDLVSLLRPFRGVLQTVCILCPEKADDRLREQFFRAGAVRITSPDHMSLGYRGEPHDGEMSMRRYVKRVSVEIP